MRELADTAKSLANAASSGNFGLEEAIGLTLSASLLAATFGIPFFAGWLRKARPILWVLRILALGIVGSLALLLYNVWRFHVLTAEMLGEMGRTPEPFPFRIGMWIYFSSLILTTLGLWMIPKAMKPQPYSTSEIPTTEDRR